MADIADVTSGQSPPGSSYNQDGIGMEFHQGKKHFGDSSLNASGVWTTEVTRKALPGDIVMSVRAPVGPINYVDREVCIGRGLASIRPNEAIKRGFLEKFLLMNEGRINGHAGATFNSINKKEIEGILVPLPHREEQERIVEVLNEAFAAIDKAKANIERNLVNARELFQSRLNDIFSNPSSDWDVKPLGEVCDFQNGFAFKSKWYSESGTRVIRIGDIQSDSVDIQSARCVEESSIDDDFNSYVIPHGAILIAMSGATTGKIGVFTHRVRALLNQRVGCLQPLPEINQRFFWNFMKFYSVSYLEISAGSAQPNLSTKQICSTPILVPPRAVQDRICEELDQLSEMTEFLAKGYQTELVYLEELRQSILEQAFGGKFTKPIVI